MGKEGASADAPSLRWGWENAGDLGAQQKRPTIDGWPSLIKNPKLGAEEGT